MINLNKKTSVNVELEKLQDGRAVHVGGLEAITVTELRSCKLLVAADIVPKVATGLVEETLRATNDLHKLVDERPHQPKTNHGQD